MAGQAGREKFDLAVIGAGPGGYVACVRAAQLGMKVVCVERDARLGGVCVNVGCIPSKALLDSSELFHLAVNRLADHGVLTEALRFDLSAMMNRKDKVVKELSDNVRKLLAGNRVEIVRGTGRLAGEDRVEISGEVGNDSAGAAGGDSGADAGGGGREGGRTILEARHILLATGSEPVQVPNIPFDGVRIVDSTGALAFDLVPGHLAIVGGGYIGLELGSVWSRLGAKVTVIEMMPRIAGLLDEQVGRALARILAKQGMAFRTSTKVVEAGVHDDEVRLVLDSHGGREEMDCDRLLVAVGRRPLTKGLGLEEVNVKIDSRTGQVIVDEGYRTNIPSIYAIGDLIAGPMLAHKASAEGIAAVECMAGLDGEVNYDTVPSVIYTSPEVASVGLTEEQVKARDIPYCVGTYPFAGAGRARCMGETEGFVKMIAHARTDRLLGVHIIGPRASDLLSECVLAMDLGAGSQDIARSVHGHPTFSEALHEAAMAVKKCSIYAS